ncbi:glycoside hydrolase family 97 protein [Mucilaginibacter sp. BJC16-A38]|uniref:glycoside hydrolase family 97 protein n=1 Tax=Mucilaginibacter phenanthrenivorans TaxID=1234842 RepID=UPI0021573BF9|nr:glycoside hydrolase family 97 protein [Mucilaginibacter phenanthrenivorans]MCR8561867.1 glycoside hydrolase family 97 protein [Mucilaginibacter phenanthrenivorans]
MKIKVLLLLCFMFSLCATAQTGKTYQVKSPDGKISVSIVAGAAVSWSVKHEDTEVIMPSEISMTLDNGEILGKNAVVKKASPTSSNTTIITPIYKKSQVKDNFNQLTLSFKGDYSLVFRVYDDGAAYRFITQKKGDITIVNEEANFKFKDDDKAFLPFVSDYRNKDKFTTSFEGHYDNISLSAIKKDTLAFLPVLIDVGSPKKAVILEADLQDYPGMYLTQGESNSLHGVFAKYPTEEAILRINYVVKQRAGYIAKTAGTRSFPWRVVVISTEDKQLADNDMMQKLAEPSQITDYSWIKPGKVAWDWWNDWNVTHVDFKAGINVPTYKYYTDFAAANKLEYIIIDEGWSDDYDLNKTKLDVQQIVDYAKQKNVGVILWATWYSFQRDTEGILAKYEKMGVKGFKVDFIDRDDQKMVSSLYAIAKTAAAHHMLIDYHGMYKPSGMQRTWPNIINCEGVKGLENMKWGTDNQPGYDVSIPYIRMTSGSMDYTPGGMRNATKEAFRPVNSNPMTQGTRCHQLAMYTVFEAPLQMLSDNPSIYQREQESTNFIAAVPTTFDATVSLDGKVGDFVSIARKKGSTWYAGVMTNWNPRNLTVDLSFLGDGSYKAIIFEDGINANKDATDYTTKTITVTAKDKLNIKIASGGGWAARFEKL